MGWAVFLIGCAVTVLAGWALFARGRSDRLLSVLGLTLLPPTIWAAALGLKIGSCKEGSCVTHTQHNLLVVAVAALVVLALALVALYMQRTPVGGGLMLLSAALGVVSVWKVDRVTSIAFAILALAVASYDLVLYLHTRPEAPEPDFPAI